MARARNIKPSIMDNEELAELEPLTRLLFVYLWMLADREGRLEDRPKRIAAQALPYDRTVNVDAMLDDLHRSGFIVRYEAQGIACIQITAFAKHQTPHVREAASTLPEMEQGTTKAVSEHCLGSAEASPRSPDSLIPDSLIPDCGLGTELAGQAPSVAVAPPPTSKSKRGTQIPPDFEPSESGLQYAKQKRVDAAAELQSFRNYHEAKGSVFKDWQAAWRTWCDKAVEFGRAGQKAGGRQPMSFAERDQIARRKHWEEMTGRKWPTEDERQVIDITPEDDPLALPMIGGAR